MKTIRTCRNFHGGPISVVALSLLEKRAFPVSVNALVNGDGYVHYEGRSSAGDIDCNWKLDFYSNGFWYAKADMHDSGIISGDFYRVSFVLDNDHSVGIAFEGQIDVIGNRHYTHQDNGIDPWVRDNWVKLLQNGATVHLHSAVDVGEIVTLILLGLAIAAGAAFTFDGKKKCSRPCRDGGGGAVFGNGMDNQPKPCVEFYDCDNPPPP